MNLYDIKSFRDFLKWLVSIPGNLLTVFKEDGPESPYSSRRVALAFAIIGASKSLLPGINASISIATKDSATWIMCAVPFIPFALCVGVVILIITKITATDIQTIIEKAKG